VATLSSYISDSHLALGTDEKMAISKRFLYLISIAVIAVDAFRGPDCVNVMPDDLSDFLRQGAFIVAGGGPSYGNQVRCQRFAKRAVLDRLVELDKKSEDDIFLNVHGGERPTYHVERQNAFNAFLNHS